MTPESLPLGKLPPQLLSRLLAELAAANKDERVLLGPGVGLDCAIIDTGPNLLVLKMEPITFVTDEIGWYSVQVSLNDLATTGATPRWMLATLLLPEHGATPQMVESIFDQVRDLSAQYGITLVGGHTEVTFNLDRPIVVVTLIGEVTRERLVTPRGAAPGDRVLLTKGVPIEGTAILAREFPGRLAGVLSTEEIETAARFLYTPGISVWRDAQLALGCGGVTGMHDPTEGGLAAALWEMAEASQATFRIDAGRVPIPAISGRVCQAFGLDPLGTIASGALLITAREDKSAAIIAALQAEGIACVEIGAVAAGAPEVWDNDRLLPRPERDEITRVYEQAQ